MTACSGISINFDALKEMLSPYDPNKVKQEKEETPDVPETPEEPENPEEPEEPAVPTTEEEFKVACEERIKQILEDSLFGKTGYQTVTGIDDVVYNIETGYVYANVKLKFVADVVEFYKFGPFDKIAYTSYEQALEKLNEVKPRKINNEPKRKLLEKVSEEEYNALCEYVLNHENINMPEGKILNIEPFTSFGTAKITAIYEGKIYVINASSSLEDATDEEFVSHMLNNQSDNEIYIRKEEPFMSFDDIGKAAEEEVETEGGNDVEAEVQPANASACKKFSKKLCLKNVAVELDKQENGKWVINFDLHDEKLFNNDKTLIGINNAVVEPKKVVKERGFASCGASL